MKHRYLGHMVGSICLTHPPQPHNHHQQNADWSIIFLIKGILFLENWDYISKFKFVWKFILLKRRVRDLSDYWKVGVNRPLKQIYWDISFPSSFFVVKI